ncbi:MAG: hypothetical protein OXC37_04675 [Bdellovibrionaceae bacterium]|nr:hypothetical protein [Pseudobdellovibrionaceae bacterium]
MKIKFKKYIIIFYTLLLSSFSCSNNCKSLNETSCDILKNFRVFNKDSVLNFNHLCSDLDYDSEFARQSYVLFEKSESDLKALILANLRVGWLGLNEPQGIAIDLMEIKIESLWPQAQFSLALEMMNRTTKETIRGEFVSSYLVEPHFKVNYQLDNKGNINWQNFFEPEEKVNQSTDKLYYSPIPAPSIRLANFNKEELYQLSLIIKEKAGKEEIKLEGPYIQNINSLLNIKKPQLEVLSFSDTFNPYQESGFWSWLFEGFKYDKCIFTRKKARKDFQKTFTRL